MRWKYLVSVSLWFGTLAMLLAQAPLAQAASTSVKPSIDARMAARLLREIRVDAEQVRSAAARLDGLTKSSSVSWIDYDRQWNEIKPAQEDMEIKLGRLERIQAALSPEERKQLDQSKPMIGQIQLRTHELRVLLDKPGVQTGDSEFKTYAISLRRAASQLGRTTSAT